jgi:dolichol kinase
VVLPFLCFFVAIEIFRRLIFGFNERLFRIFKYILKENEKKSLLSATWLVLSVFLTILFFRKDIAITAMLFLIFGDISSSIIGTYFGRIRIRNYSLEGSLAFFITCLIISLIINFTPLGLPWLVVVVGALSATLIELLPWLDDNFTIALFSSIMMTIVLKFLH